ncbi:hypothetical protein CMV_015767 [Castanea mollissima]|uniref:Uncharacterized protein n=1 Tax=Castanea mollissima TaxID=60419 RepID=A0A8J4R9L7_9ROSI|nr:hypothetical protein CMV_015767 [Castanea mollissima]
MVTKWWPDDIEVAVAAMARQCEVHEAWKKCHATMESLVKKAVVWEDVENEAMSCGDEIVNKKGYCWREYPQRYADPGSGPVINSSGASPAGQDMMSYADNVNSSVSVFGKRENQDAQMSPLPNFNKKGRPTPVGLDGMQQQQIGPHIDGLTGSDINWKNSLLQPQVMARGISYANMPIQKFTHQAFEGTLNQDAGTYYYDCNK